MVLTVNEALVWKKTLQARLSEVVSLRDQNSAVQIRRYGVGGDKDVETKPVYDVKGARPDHRRAAQGTPHARHADQGDERESDRGRVRPERRGTRRNRVTA